MSYTASPGQPASINLKLMKNDTWELVFTLTDSAGSAFDVSGATFLCQFRTNVSDASTVKDFTAGYFTISGVGNNIVTLLVPKAETNISGPYHYDIECTYVNTKTQTLIKGMVYVTADVTQ